GGVVVAVDDADQVHLRELLQLLLHEPDPGVLVGRRGGRGDDRDVPAAVDLLGEQVHLTGPDLGGGGLVHEQVPAGGRVRVVGNDGDALGHGAVQGRAERGWVGGGHDEGVRPLADPGHPGGDQQGGERPHREV